MGYYLRALKDSRVKSIQFSRNFGQHYGIIAGLDHCNGDWVVVMDCDLQDPPEEIPRLYAKAQEGYDVVLARRGKRQDPLFKRLTSGLFYPTNNQRIPTQQPTTTRDSRGGGKRINLYETEFYACLDTTPS